MGSLQVLHLLHTTKIRVKLIGVNVSMRGCFLCDELATCPSYTLLCLIDSGPLREYKTLSVQLILVNGIYQDKIPLRLLSCCWVEQVCEDSLFQNFKLSCIVHILSSVDNQKCFVDIELLVLRFTPCFYALYLLLHTVKYEFGQAEMETEIYKVVILVSVEDCKVN